MSGSFPSSCHVVLKCAAELTAVCRRLSFPFFFLVRRAFLSRSKMSLSIELLIHFLVTFSPGMRRESRREEPRWRGFDRGRAGLTMYGAFWLRWQVWNAALAVGNRSAYSARNTCGSPPAGFLHLGGCLIHQDPSLLGKYMHKCLYANYLSDWRVLTSSLIVQVWSDCAGNAIESRMTHALRALNIFHDLRCFCLGRSFDLSDIG